MKKMVYILLVGMIVCTCAGCKKNEKKLSETVTTEATELKTGTTEDETLGSSVTVKESDVEITTQQDETQSVTEQNADNSSMQQEEQMETTGEDAWENSAEGWD